MIALACASVRLDAGWSKNRIWRSRRGVAGGRALSAGARARRDDLARRLAADLADRRVARAPMLIEIDCAKPDHRMDAINVVDLVADAVQVATGIDDRWYGLGSLTWRVAPSSPVLAVVVTQAADAVDVAACGRCGALWPVTLPHPEQADCPPCRAARPPRRRRPPAGPAADPRPGDPAPW